MRTILLDLSSAGVANVRDYLDPPESRKPPGQYSKPDSIAAWQRQDFDSDVSRAGLDLDLARLTGAAWKVSTEAQAHVSLAKSDEDELVLLQRLSTLLGGYVADCQIVTYGGHRFDLPLLMRRAKYRGVKIAAVNLDRYRSPHLDLCDALCDRDNTRRRSLDWMVRRLGWTDLLPKPMAGKDEAQVFEHGNWDGLEASLLRDIEAMRRLHLWWLGTPEPIPAGEPLF